MKRFNQNMILFVLSVLFLVLGLWGNCFSEIWDTGILYVESILQGQPTDFDEFQQEIDKISTKNLSYHNTLVDIHSGKEALLGTHSMKKDNTVVIKAMSGSLVPFCQKMPEDIESNILGSIKDLQSLTEEIGANFLYVAVPNKAYYVDFPVNFSNYAPSNYDAFIQALQEQNTPYYNFADTVRELELDGEELYFHTDHHWTPRAAFLANQMLCKDLSQQYGFVYDKTYLELQNYEVTTYPDHALGSYGKKTGRFFSQYHADDFDLIIPKFETEFVINAPYVEDLRQGKFEDTLLFMPLIKKGYYNVSNYSIYLRGNNMLQIIQNVKNPTGKKFVILKDSFANTLIPYLAPQASEIHVIDIRSDVKGWTSDFSAAEYIKQIHPDYVLIIYNGPLASDWKSNKFLFQ